MTWYSLIPPLNLDSIERDHIWELAFKAGRRSTEEETQYKLENLKLRCMRECMTVWDETGSPRAEMCRDRIFDLDIEAHEWLEME